MRAAALWVLFPALSACNTYDWFRLTGYIQEGYTNKADILFVIDNSTSMTDESSDLATNFSAFIEPFADEQPPADPSLTNDVDRFLAFVNDRAANVNYQLGITTTDVSEVSGALLGDPGVVAKTDNNPDRRFINNLVCDAACINKVPEGVDVSCGNPNNTHCADSAAGSVEEGIEAVFMAMCRAVPNPPAPCFQKWWPAESGPNPWQDHPPGLDTDNPVDTDELPPPIEYFGDDDVGTNADWLRDGSVVIPVIVTDEGDQSRRIDSRDGKVFPYDEYFKLFGHRMSWVVIGPSERPGACKANGTDWGIKRYERLVYGTNGVYIPISVKEGSDSCVNADFAEALGDIGDLLRSLVSAYPLRATPVPGTIVVNVGGLDVEESEETYNAEIEQTEYSDGWSYSATDNTVVLHGDAVPDPNEDVRIWYLPSEGAPREFPF